MFERFTDRARRVVVLAQQEARDLGHNYIGTEHILLALIDEGQGVAAKALTALGISQDAARQRVEDIIGRGRVPVLVGGSGLYVRAALDDLHFPGTDSALPPPLPDRRRWGEPRGACRRDRSADRQHAG